jgi:hypothetical protein
VGLHRQSWCFGCHDQLAQVKAIVTNQTLVCDDPATQVFADGAESLLSA